eukprot:TRINITY_DN3723_c0_g1_i2.p1 TRINITY_DN3723_c0_g1~~TRINITY_DN3723_c0_g1_i2.p1  ORF type:complete len:154 (-),score=50.39 TRINITY_DN3723_c0_g1_i2:172-633(-)
MLVTTDDGLKSYLGQVLSQLSEWLMQRSVQKLVLVVSGVESGEVLERWVFDVETDGETTDAESKQTKPEKEIMGEIQAIIRQITASVTFLPLLQETCTFDLLVYTNVDCAVPGSWAESDPKYISNSSEVRLRSFTTKVHKVDAMVAYRVDDSD